MMTLAFATRFAGRIYAELQPLCEAIQIAGSIRRRRPAVRDIDLVILPKNNDPEPIKERCRRSCHPIIEGKAHAIYQLPKLELNIDLYFAHPEDRDLYTVTPSNFGTMLLCRTGSKEHNIYLTEHAKKLGLKWSPHDGVIDPQTGNVLASETEEAIFEALRLPYVKPEDRER